MNAIALEKDIHDDDIKEVVANHCCIAMSCVTVSSVEGRDLPGGMAKDSVRVVKSYLTGEFPVWLDIYSNAAIKSDGLLAVSFASKFGIAALVRDPTPNPYRWIKIIPPDGEFITVVIDGTQFDDHDKIVILDDE